jgi:hypothetical protein
MIANEYLNRIITASSNGHATVISVNYSSKPQYEVLHGIRLLMRRMESVDGIVIGFNL